VFYTPAVATTSLVIITADLPQDTGIRVRGRIEHFCVLEGGDLNFYLLVQCVCVILVGTMFVDSSNQLYQRILEARPSRDEEDSSPDQEPESWKPISKSFLLAIFLDYVTTFSTIWLISRRIPNQMSSGFQTDQVVGNFLRFDWQSSDTSISEKRHSFFEEVNTLMDKFNDEKSLTQMAVWIVCFNMLRVVSATGAHPRLGILTGTLTNAVDDLFHFMMIAFIIAIAFCAIGFAFFGELYEDFRSVGITSSTMGEMMLGNLPEAWEELATMQLYVVFFLVICFFLLQNFLLAIIVEAYMGVRKEILQLDVEMNYVQDCYYSFQGSFLGWMYSWPDRRKLGGKLLEWQARFSIGYKDLENTKMFKDSRSLQRFVKHYHGFAFITPIEIRNFSPSQPGMEVVDEIERRTASLLGHGSTLSEMAKRAFRFQQNKVAERAKHGAANVSMKWKDKMSNPVVFERTDDEGPDDEESSPPKSPLPPSSPPNTPALSQACHS